MYKFEVIYEFSGKKTWENIVAKDKKHAMDLILEKNNNNNILFISIEKIK